MAVVSVAAPLARAIDERGPTAYLVTVGGDDRPHVVAVTVGWRGEGLVADAGRTTTANVGLHPDVTLIWPARPGRGYSLIVDGRARSTAGDQPSSLIIDPRKAVLHRTPEGDSSSPSCITVFPPP